MDYNPYARFGVNMNPMQYQQAPSMGAMPNAFQQPRQVVKVSGMDGARSFAAAMPPNSTDAVFDENRDVFYFLSTDGGGFPTVRPFSFAPFEESKNANNQFVTHEELNNAMAQIQEMIANAQQPVSAEPKSTRRKPGTQQSE